MKKELPDILDAILKSLPSLQHEACLVGVFIIAIIWDLAKGNVFKKSLPYVVILGIAGAMFFIPTQTNLAGLIGLGKHDSFLKYLFSIAAIAILSFDKVFQKSDRVGEYYSILIAMLIGMNIVLMSDNLLVLYLGIETISICSYILTAFKFDKRSSEGSMKYLLFGAFSSAIMLYGISLLYGMSHSLAFTEVLNHPFLQEELLAQLGLIFTLAGIFFKLSAVPFHIWTPDVYEAAPTPISAFFSIAPKAAVLYVVSNWVLIAKDNELFIIVLALVAIASILVGNLSALKQKSLKRMLAYSSIAHAGFLLIAALASPQAHFYFYISIYLLMNLAAFGFAHWLEEVTGDDLMENVRGVGLKLPFLGVLVSITMISLAGLPSTAGFNAKLLIFIDLWGAYTSAANPWLIALFAIGLVNVVIAFFYYLKLPYLLFFKSTDQEIARFSGLQKAYFTLLVAPLLLFFFKPDWLLALIHWLNTSY